MDARIRVFYRQYLQEIKVDKLCFPSNDVLLDPMVQYQLNRFMFTTHLLFPSEGGNGAFLPREIYQKRVAKELTRRIQEAIRNPNEDVGHRFSFPRSSRFRFL
jgi:hypothetical protein